MSKRADLAGRRFGRLLALRYAGPSKRGHALWLCRCDCGTEKVASAGSFVHGRTQSCGCLRREQLSRVSTGRLPRLSPGELALNRLYATYRCGAVKRQFAFHLTRPEFLRLVSSTCHYCGVEPRQVVISKRRHAPADTFTYNGIDRIDNADGYSLANCVPCCGDCNRAKHALSLPEFLKWIGRLSRHQRGQCRSLTTAVQVQEQLPLALVQ